MPRREPQDQVREDREAFGKGVAKTTPSATAPAGSTAGSARAPRRERPARGGHESPGKGGDNQARREVPRTGARIAQSISASRMRLKPIAADRAPTIATMIHKMSPPRPRWKSRHFAERQHRAGQGERKREDVVLEVDHVERQTDVPQETLSCVWKLSFYFMRLFLIMSALILTSCQAGGVFSGRREFSRPSQRHAPRWISGGRGTGRDWCGHGERDDVPHRTVAGTWHVVRSRRSGPLPLLDGEL